MARDARGEILRGRNTESAEEAYSKDLQDLQRVAAGHLIFQADAIDRREKPVAETHQPLAQLKSIIREAIDPGELR